MSLDIVKDGRLLRVALLLTGLALVGLACWVTCRACSHEFDPIQGRFRKLADVPERRDLGIQQEPACGSTVDRCTTCHLGIRRDDLAGPEVPQPYRKHPSGTISHLHRRTGCSVCHGGTGRALSVAVAHSMPGTGHKDPLLTQPYLQASCARCHLPGARPGMERLVAGANLYLVLGCSICHPLNRGGRGGWDFGPDLRSTGRKSLAYLEASLIDPAANFPQSTMPTFRDSFRGKPDYMENMLVFLLSLEQATPDDCRHNRGGSVREANSPCASCHAGRAGQASGRREHRCVYILERKQELNCASCHAETVPEPGHHQGRCPVIDRHRGNCSTCHDSPGLEGQE